MKTRKDMQLWTAAEVAYFYGCAVTTVGAWRREGLIPHIELITGDYRYDMIKVREAMEVKRGE